MVNDKTRKPTFPGMPRLRNEALTINCVPVVPAYSSPNAFFTCGT